VCVGRKEERGEEGGRVGWRGRARRQVPGKEDGKVAAAAELLVAGGTERRERACGKEDGREGEMVGGRSCRRGERESWSLPEQGSRKKVRHCLGRARYDDGRDV